MSMAKQHAEVFKCEAQITKDVYFLRPVTPLVLDC